MRPEKAPQGRIRERVSSTHTGLGIVPVPTARLEKLKSHRSRARYSKGCCLSRGNISPTLKNSPGFTSDILKAKKTCKDRTVTSNLTVPKNKIQEYF